MSSVSLRNLLEAGVHFGHQTRLWNPKMRPFIYGEKNGIHIIDLQQTAMSLTAALRFLTTVAARGQSILFVGTKRAAREIVLEQATRAGMFYVNNRWLGGTLTNYQTVKKSIERLIELESARDEGKFEFLTKKEALDLTRKIGKMEKSLGGIKTMPGVPGAMFVIDPRREHIAVSEALKLRIPVVALCDTNCDPDGIAHVIPGNDDAIKSIELFTAAVAESIIQGLAAGRDAFEDNVPAVDVENVEIYRRGTAEGAEEDVQAASAEEAGQAASAEAAEEAAPAEAAEEASIEDSGEEAAEVAAAEESEEAGEE
jgi:small subunit ribosomal protein S2